MNNRKNAIKFVGAGAILILICATSTGTATLTKTSNEKTSRDSYTHTVLVEVGTAQWCPPCHYWNNNIYTAYNSGLYDFEYVEMIVRDHSDGILNMDAYKRMINNYGIAAYPTSVFDGDYLRLEGNYPAQLPGLLNTCGNRAVADLEADMIVYWFGNATINVNINIQNNEATQYNGHIRAYIVEITSRYDTVYGADYHNGFLAYAFDKDISINSGDIYTDATTWNGNDHADNHGDDFGDIALDNVKVILAVFDNVNRYVDETVAALVNTPPEIPELLSGPTQGITGKSYAYNTSTTDPDDDQIFYKWDWGDGNFSDWLGPYDSGETAEANHTWSERGIYNIAVKAKDEYNAESGWSDPLQVKVVILGDMNDDGLINGFDIDPFVLALADPDEYEAQYGIDPDVVGDINQDGVLNGFDIDPFVDLISGG